MRKPWWILCLVIVFGALTLNAAETRDQCESKCTEKKLMGCKSCCVERARLASNACNSTAWNKYKSCAKASKSEEERQKCQDTWDAAVKACQPDTVDITKSKCENPPPKK
jgi:hypothetical protein